MKRRAGLVIALVVGALGLAVFDALRPHVYRGEGARAGWASEAKLRASVEALPPRRCVDNEAPTARVEALVTESMRALGYEVKQQRVDHDHLAAHSRDEWQAADAASHRHAPSHNLIATKGLADSGPVLLVAAHLDSVCESRGADDNGSGVAVLLEMARILSERSATGRVLFAFFAEEEEGKFGSTYFVSTLDPALRERLRAVVVDPIGYTTHEAGSQRYPGGIGAIAPDRGDFLGMISLTEDHAFASALIEARRRAAPPLTLVTLNLPAVLARELPDLWRSDHAPFWEAGVPTVFLTDTGDFRNPHYHFGSDAPETLDYAFMAAIADTLVELAASFR